ncbi:hypothetical protein Q7Z28_00615 [Glaesserella parasuis]|uniref:hypothetical protein n=1 Tax=Glaesserella parasuis TaxID=738 RepID=UPI0003AC013C|nr:hypothetical protein [Glaesserella parasuis]ATW43346.1 hypothetical protein A2U20_05825 [Glaesserella parasuis D74]EQA10809.1 hypothetical protein HPSD74_0509 [Glaesserella parasuis D74]MDP0316695.1 hypothetical protein [Glaesserella parasuis]
MISETDKQQILNGKLAISRDGTKCKYIGLSSHYLFPYMFMYLNEEDRIISAYLVTSEFTFCTDGEQGYDIIGLWKNKEQPFNLDKALEGHPVKLRNGLKAYVKYCLPPDFNGIYPVQGYIIKPGHTPNMEIQRWNLKGKYWTTDSCEELFPYDIISMWEEDEPEADKDS